MPWIYWIRRFVDVRVARGEKESVHDHAGVLPKVDLFTGHSTDELVVCVTENLCLLVETLFVGALEVIQQRLHRVVEINQLLVQIFDDMSALNQRDAKWTQSITVGDKEFVMETKAKLGAKAIGRRGMKNVEGHELKERQSPYNPVFDPEKCSLSLKNDHLWHVS